MTFRIGRRSAQHSYPATPRSAPAAFARNSAVAEPGITATPVTAAGTLVAWSYIESKGSALQPANTFDVPITSKVTGVVRVFGTVQVSNPTGADIDASVLIQVDGTSIIPPGAIATVNPTIPDVNIGAQTLPFVVDIIPTVPPFIPGPLPIGVTKNIRLLIIGSVDGLTLGPVTLDIQELPQATG